MDLLDILIFLLAIDSIIFFLCLLMLSFREKVMIISDLPKFIGGPIPPKHMLNSFGKKIHVVLWISASLLPIGVLALVLV